MPLIVNFTKLLVLTQREHYINDCCIGGDLVLDQLLPSMREQYGSVQLEQEDWGWFVWFTHIGVKLAFNVHTIDAALGQFAIHLISRLPRLLFPAKIDDTPELDVLRDTLARALTAWPVTGLASERTDETRLPIPAK